jgi:hypothetical protein
MVRPAQVGGSQPVEMAVGLVLILISALMIAFIVRTVQANMPKA